MTAELQKVKIMPSWRASPTIEEKCSEGLRVARELFHQTPDWVTFFRLVLGLDGVVRQLFGTPDELLAFERTNEYQEIQRMLAELRALGGDLSSREPMRVITVRMPKSLHEALKSEARELHTSINKLCISKLLQSVESRLVPVESASTAPPVWRTNHL
jgi:hypothetical protein